MSSNASKSLKDIEDELNSYPIKGFTFKVDSMDVSRDLSRLYASIKLRIHAQFDFKDMADPAEVVTWFYLILDDYVKDPYNDEFEVIYRHSRGMKEIYADLTVQAI